MSYTRQWVKNSLVGVAIASLAGCVARPNLVAAHIKKGTAETEVIEVVLPAGDAKIIKSREIYFAIVVFDCRNYGNYFPIQDLYIGGARPSSFHFPIEAALVTIQGSIPKRLLAGFPTSCVFLRGGSYLFGKLESSSVPLVRLAP